MPDYNFKVGDEITISNPQVCLFSCNDEMAKMQGRRHKIVSITPNSKGPLYRINDSGWSWSANCFTPVIPQIGMDMEAFVSTVGDEELSALWEKQKEIVNKLNAKALEVMRKREIV